MFLTRRLVLPAIILSWPGLLLAKQASHAIVDVTVLTMESERLLEHQTVLVVGDRITEMGPVTQVRVPAASNRIDGRSRFLMPALGDAHVHLSTPGGTPELAERAMTLLVLHGVAMARSMYTEPHHRTVALAVEEGRLLGPRLQLVSPPLSGQNGSTSETAMEFVRRNAADGYPIIKIMPGLSCHAFDSAAAEARRQNRRLAGHVPLDVGLRHALESGYISIEHLDGLLEALLPPGSATTPSRGGFFGLGLIDAIDEGRIGAVITMVKESGVTIVPTESGMERFVSMEAGAAIAQLPEMRFVPPFLVNHWIQQKDGFVRGVGVTVDRATRYQAIRRRLIRELHDAGVPVALGSDGWSLFHLPGISTLNELETYVVAGLTPFEALRTATVNVARLMSLEAAAGTVTQGAPADLLLLDANPLQEIGAVRRPAGVLIRGQWLPRSEIERRLSSLAAGQH